MTLRKRIITLAKQVPEKYLEEAVGKLLEIKEAADSERAKNTVYCLYCSSARVEANPSQKESRFYVCRECGEAFSEKAAAEVAGSYFKGEMWKQMIRCTVNGVPLEEASRDMGLSHSTVYRMRNKILSCALTNILEGSACLKGVCEPDKYDAFKSNLENIKGRKKVNATYLSRYAGLFPQIVDDRDLAADKIYELMTSRMGEGA